MAFDQGGDLRARAPHQQVPLPVAGDGTILDFGGSLADRDALDDRGPAWRLSTRPAHEPGAPQVPQELLLENVACLDEEASIDRLVRHAHRSIMRECVPEANGDLPWRPIALQVPGNPIAQPTAPRQQAWLRPASPLPSACIGIGCPI